jgi:hypothetical protein
MLPDFLPVKERAALVAQSKAINNGIDTDADLKYDVQPKESELEIEEVKDSISEEYIFLIDRSGSMDDAIMLVREALQLFVQSLPFGCYFNICSYGTKHKFLFKTSVPLND